ncbi:MAG: hypothetical protein AAF928_20925 [Myxococcota bacterium]
MSAWRRRGQRGETVARMLLVCGGGGWTLGCTQVSGLSSLAECEGEGCTEPLPSMDPDPNPDPDPRLGPLAEPVRVSAGRYTSCVTSDVDGRAFCWGLMPGDGSPASTTPVVVQGISRPLATAHGFGHSCALVVEGDVYCWGNNEVGQIGDGTNITRVFPTKVDSLSDVSKISVGAYHTCATTADGGQFCWGSNAYGQLGNGTFDDSARPTPVVGLDATTHFGAGAFHSCAVLSTPEIRCWGRNDHGQLGSDPGVVAVSALPTAPSADFPPVERVYPGAVTTCARSANTRELYCWGDNRFGQLGDGTTTSSYAPVLVPDFVRLGVLYPGLRHTCAWDNPMGDDQRGYCWGANDHGQVGVTGDDQYPTPQAIFERSGELAAKNTEHTCYISRDDEVLCAGLNDVGQLGDGTTSSRAVFAAVLFPP